MNSHHTIDQNTEQFTALFFEYAKKMMKQSKMNEDITITPDNIYQIAHKANRDLLFEIVKKSHLPGSTILGVENIIKLNKLAEDGKACLILSEHVSNLDVPSMFVRFYDHPDDKLKEIFEKFIFIAGTKLNQTPLVKLYTEMFSRVVIYAIRGMTKFKNDEELELAKKINAKAIRKIKELRNNKHIFVIYPSGTRYRPWLPETKKGLKEITSYLNSFDYFCCSSINGNNMPPKEHEDMTREHYIKDTIVFNFGEVQNTKEFIQKITKDQSFSSIEDKDNMKQMVIDHIMEKIFALHEETEKFRLKFINNS